MNHIEIANRSLTTARWTARFSPTRLTRGCVLALGTVTLLAAWPAAAQNYPITPAQRSTATQVAQAGVPLSELAPNAPDFYTVKRGDTLWAISRLFLRSPWRWPELWGMNLKDIRNPHLIYPGQQLFLEKKNGRAILSTRPGDGAPTDTVRVSPRTRIESLADLALPTLQPHLIEPFLTEPMVVEENTLLAAPRIVATQEDRVLLSRGDRAYARGTTPIAYDPKSAGFRVFRNATPLKDPVTQEVLGFEAQYIGRAALVRGEGNRQITPQGGATTTEIVPATIDIISTKEEIRTGDRLLPEPPRQLLTYTPHAPQGRLEGSVVSIYGNSVKYAAQNQVVVINRGTRDGIESGHVLAIITDGERVIDKTDTARPLLKLPDERNGLLMVFRPFERVSYALILEITSGVKVGDRVVNPR